MLIYLMIACAYQASCFIYEFKDKAQCESAVKAFIKRDVEIRTRSAYCQEVRK